MKFYLTTEGAHDEATRLARRNKQDYFISQDSRYGIVRLAVCTRREYMRVGYLLPTSTVVVRPDAPTVERKTTMTDADRTDAVAELLRQTHQLQATSEHTGGGIYCVLLPDAKARGVWYWGMACEMWAGECVELGGCGGDEDLQQVTTISSESDDVAAIAAAIAELMRPHTLPCGVLADVVQNLQSLFGLAATVEHPGYVSLPASDAKSWACGTINHARWECQLTDAAGQVYDTMTTPVAETETDGYRIAKAIIAALGIERQ